MGKIPILFLTNAFPDFDSSYRGIFIKRMAEYLDKEGYEITVVTPKIYKESRYFDEQNGIKIYRFPFFARDRLLIEHRKIPYLRMILYYISGTVLTIYMAKKKRCALVHVHWAIPTGLIGVMIRFLFKIPFIVTIHGSDFRIALEGKEFLKKIFLYVCKKAMHIHCVSEVQEKELKKLGILKDKISSFPMGVDENFINLNKRRNINGENHEFLIVSNRNLIKLYNVPLLIRAIPIILKANKNVKFIIAGDGEEKEKIIKEVRDLNLTEYVKFLGRIPHKEMPELLMKSDIYVSTSLYDGTSVSLLEAMASGCFPVVSDIPSNREWIKDGENGFLFHPKNEVLLANKIIDAINDKELRYRSSFLNKSLIKEKALWPVCIDKIKELYKNGIGL